MLYKFKPREHNSCLKFCRISPVSNNQNELCGNLNKIAQSS